MISEEDGICPVIVRREEDDEFRSSVSSELVRQRGVGFVREREVEFCMFCCGSTSSVVVVISVSSGRPCEDEEGELAKVPCSTNSGSIVMETNVPLLDWV